MIHICSVLIICLVIESVFLIYLLRIHKNKTDIKAIVQFFRELWMKFVLYVLATSVIGLFLGSVYFEKVVGLNEINNWVSIVLGLVALIIGIISLILSFYNLDQANDTQEKTVEILQRFQIDMIDRMNKLQEDVENKIDESSEKTRSEIRTAYSDPSGLTIKRENSEQDWDD